MKEGRKELNVLKSILFLAQFLIIFVFCQEILVSKDGNIAGFYDCENALDVVAVGPSTMFCSLKPSIMAEEYNVNAYDFGSSAQTLDISFFYIKEVFRYQTPDLIILDVSRIELPEGISRNAENTARWAFTSIKPSMNLYRELLTRCGGANKEFFSYICPIVFYHDRYADIHKNDLLQIFGLNSSTSGGYVKKITEASQEVSLCDMTENPLIVPYNIEQVDLDNLDQIISFCQQNESRVVLYRSPSTSKIWDYSHHMAMDEYAKSRNVDFIDMNMLYEDMEFAIGDMADEAHCNDCGAEKCTRMLCDKLKSLGYI